MDTKLSGPPKIKLNPVHCDTCRQMLQRDPEIRDFLTRCQNCNLDMTELFESLDQLKAFAQSVLREFFAGQA
jgi:hypothetical protein